MHSLRNDLLETRFERGTSLSAGTTIARRPPRRTRSDRATSARLHSRSGSSPRVPDARPYGFGGKT